MISSKMKKVNKTKISKNLKGDYSNEAWMKNLVSCDFEDNMDEFASK